MSQDFRYALADALSDLQRRKPEAIEAASEIMNLMAFHGYTQASARITELESLLAEAREVVKPFVPAANDWNEMGDSRPINMWQVDNRGDYPVTVGMLRRAAALSTKLGVPQ